MVIAIKPNTDAVRTGRHWRRLEALADFVAAYEADNGEITPEEMKQAGRRARSRAIAVRETPVRKQADPLKGRRSR